jgi:prepilin-type N-terminal cleavage/methylation domain-containing protein
MESKKPNIKYEKVNKSFTAKCRDVILSREKGFSIVETIVAIAILSVVMVAPLTLAQRGLNASMYAKDQVTAFYLAQEAVEYARNLRDNNSLKNFSGGDQWLLNLENCIAPKKCGVDVSIPILVDCSSNLNLCRVTFNKTIGVYGLQTGGAWQSTNFIRTLQITKATVGADLNGEADLTATVSWQTGVIPRTIKIEEKLMNWFPPPAV